MPVTVVLELHLQEPHVDEVLANLARDLVDTRAYEGNLSVAVVHDQADPTHVVLIERWQQRADQERYIAWRTETGSLEKVGAMSSGPPVITYYDELREV